MKPGNGYSKNPFLIPLQKKMLYIDDLTYQIRNRNGVVIDNGKFSASTETIDLSAFPDGFYIVHIRSESNKVLHSEKIMKR